jgi:hypothetical protein
MRGSIPPLSLYVFMTWYLVKHLDLPFTFTSMNICETGWKGVDWMHLAQEFSGGCCCEEGNEHSVSIKRGMITCSAE